MKRKQLVRPKAVRDYSTMLALIASAEPLKRKYVRGVGWRGKTLESKENRAMRQKVFASPQYHSLPEAMKIAVKNHLEGKAFEKRQLLASAQTATRAEKVLHSSRGKKLRFNQVALLVLQLPAKRQKTVLFSMPFRSDRFKADVWKEVQKRRSQQHAERVRRTLKGIIGRSIPRSKICQRIASQLMTVSPAARGKLLSELGLSLVDLEHVRAIISAKRQQAMTIIAEKRAEVRWNEWGEAPSLTLPKGLYPVFKAYARALRQAGEEMPTTTQFFEMLRRIAEERGKGFDELVRELSKK